MVFFICPPHADVRAHSFTPPSPSCAHPTLLEKLYLSNYLCAYRRLHDAAARYGRPDGLLAAFMLVLLMCFLGAHGFALTIFSSRTYARLLV